MPLGRSLSQSLEGVNVVNLSSDFGPVSCMVSERARSRWATLSTERRPAMGLYVHHCRRARISVLLAALMVVTALVATTASQAAPPKKGPPGSQPPCPSCPDLYPPPPGSNGSGGSGQAGAGQAGAGQPVLPLISLGPVSV